MSILGITAQYAKTTTCASTATNAQATSTAWRSSWQARVHRSNRRSNPSRTNNGPRKRAQRTQLRPEQQQASEPHSPTNRLSKPTSRRSSTRYTAATPTARSPSACSSSASLLTPNSVKNTSSISATTAGSSLRCVSTTPRLARTIRVSFHTALISSSGSSSRRRLIRRLSVVV